MPSLDSKSLSPNDELIICSLLIPEIERKYAVDYHFSMAEKYLKAVNQPAILAELYFEQNRKTPQNSKFVGF